MEKVIVGVPIGAGSNEDFLDAAERSGWSDDPGTGKAILIPDERGAPGLEVLNPTPFAPPIGFTPTPPIDELIKAAVRREVMLRDDDEIDDIIDAEDFDIPDELPPLETIYEFVGMEPEVPAVKPVSAAERAEAQIAYEKVLEAHRKAHRDRAVVEHNKIKEAARRLYGDPPDDPDSEVKKPSPLSS